MSLAPHRPAARKSSSPTVDEKIRKENLSEKIRKKIRDARKILVYRP